MQWRALVLAFVILGCGSNDDSAASSSGSEPRADAGSGGSGSDAASNADATPDASSSGGSDAGGSDAGSSDAPFTCVGSPLPGPDPTYVLGGAMPAAQGGTLTPGLYRAVKGTHTYVEATPGACVGVVPPPVTPFRIEIELRPTQYLLRVVSSAAAGTWSQAGTAFTVTEQCPSTKPSSSVPYTATGNTFIFYGTKQDYLSGGCHFYMQYELAKQ